MTETIRMFKEGNPTLGYKLIAKELGTTRDTVRAALGRKPIRAAQKVNAEDRRNIKKKLLKLMGGKCVICGYDYCDQAMDFHHIDPTTKKFNLSTIGSFKLAAQEVTKCALLCCRCHKELHAGLIKLSDNLLPVDKSTPLQNPPSSQTY